MLKKDVVKIFQDVASRVDMKLSQETVSNLFDVFSVTLAECYQNMKEKEKTNIGDLVLKKKKVNASNRKCSLPGKEKEYTVPAHLKPVVKLKPKFVEDNKIEL